MIYTRPEVDPLVIEAVNEYVEKMIENKTSTPKDLNYYKKLQDLLKDNDVEIENRAKLYFPKICSALEVKKQVLKKEKKVTDKEFTKTLVNSSEIDKKLEKIAVLLKKYTLKDVVE